MTVLFFSIVKSCCCASLERYPRDVFTVRMHTLEALLSMHITGGLCWQAANQLGSQPVEERVT